MSESEIIQQIHEPKAHISQPLFLNVSIFGFKLQIKILVEAKITHMVNWKSSILSRSS